MSGGGGGGGDDSPCHRAEQTHWSLLQTCGACGGEEMEHSDLRPKQLGKKKKKHQKLKLGEHTV